MEFDEMYSTLTNRQLRLKVLRLGNKIARHKEKLLEVNSELQNTMLEYNHVKLIMNKRMEDKEITRKKKKTRS